MLVRKTESRIPAELTASDLGQASETINISGRKCTMISYLDKLVRYENGMISDNTYVIFVEDAKEDDDIFYKWKIEVYDQFAAEWKMDYEEKSFSEIKAVFNFDNVVWAEMPTLFFSNKVKIHIEIKIGSRETSIPPLEQIIKNFSYEFEGRKKIYPLGTNAGNLLISDQINNLYLDYIKLLQDHEPELADCNGDEFKKRRIVLALLYGNFPDKMKRIESQASVQKSIPVTKSPWELLINENSEPYRIEDETAGIAGINPLLLYQFVGDNILDVNYEPSNIRKREDNPDNNKPFNAYLLKNLADTENNFELKLIDIYNVLRFPKCCIRATSLYLEQLRKRRGYTESWNALIIERNKLAILLDEFWNGPTDQVIPKLKHKNRAQDLINADYIIQLSHLTTCEKLRTDYYSKLETGELKPIRDEAKLIWSSIEDCTIFENKYNYCKLLDPRLPSVYHCVSRYQISFDKMQHTGEEGKETENQKIVHLNVDTHTWIKDDVNMFPGAEEVDAMTDSEIKQKDKQLSLNSKVKIVVIQQFHMGQLVARDTNESIDLFISLCKELYELATGFEIESGNRFPKKNLIIDKLLKKLRELKLSHQQKPMLKQLDQSQIPSRLLFNDVDMLRLVQKATGSVSILNFGKDIIQHKVPRIFSEYTYEYIKPVRLKFKLDEPYPNYNINDPSPLENPGELGIAITELRTWSQKANCKVRLIIRGFADLSFNGTGDQSQYNEDLSQRRIDWFLQKFDVTQDENIVDDVNQHACGDRYSKIPDENPEFREVRMVFEMAEYYYKEEENE